MLEHKSHKPRKRFGQNFLLDQSIIAKILTAISPQPTEHLLEIGPGMGAITTHLLPNVTHLTAVELDRDLYQFLTQKLATCTNFSLYNADILNFDIAADISAEEYEKHDKPKKHAKHEQHEEHAQHEEHEQHEKQLRVVGNIPYNISTPLIFHLLNFSNHIQDIHLMVQKEVALRLASKHGCKTFGRLSLMVQCCCHVEYLFDIPPTAFDPKPAVDSAFIRLIPDLALAARVKNKTLLNTLVATAFNQRRKTIYNALKNLNSNMLAPSRNMLAPINLTPLNSEAINREPLSKGWIISKELLANAGINPDLRPEQISVVEYIKLSNILADF